MCDVVQHVVRSIVPSVNDNGFSRDETEEQQPTHADAAQSPDSADKTPAAPRRRRGGRRVVRGAGAAGAAVALKVEDHSAPLFAEPVVEQPLTRRRRSKAADESPETAASADSEKKDDARHAKADGKSRSASRSSKATKRHDDDADQAEPRRTRVRRRTAMFSSREDASPAVPGEPSDDDLGVDTGTDIIVRDDSADLSRALDVVSTLPQPAPRARSRCCPCRKSCATRAMTTARMTTATAAAVASPVARAMVVCHVTARRGTRTRALPPVAISTV